VAKVHSMHRRSIFESRQFSTIHEAAIAALGLSLIDVMELEAVSKEAAPRHRWQFLLTFAPLPVPGGTGFPVHPIATFEPALGVQKSESISATQVKRT